MNVFHLLYVSKATSPLKQEDVDNILDISSANNKKINVTGILLYRMGIFIQLLEGDEPEVRTLYAKIELDSRHRNSEILLEFTDNDRLFPQWYMGVITEPLDSNKLFNIAETLRATIADANSNVRNQAVAMLKTFSKKYSSA